MKALALNRVGLAMAAAMMLAGQAGAAIMPHEPLPETSYYRSLRSDYVKDWYIFQDTTADGILNPGDLVADHLKNWWTPVSSGSAGLYNDQPGAGGDLHSAAQNWATYTLPDDHPDKNNPDYNYWLPRDTGTIGFYMNYSQFDNNAWHDPNFTYGSNIVQQQIIRERHTGRNGWSLGWVINDYNSAHTQTPAGYAMMDIAVHNGKQDTTVDGWGRSVSNPQVSMSDDMDPTLSMDMTLDYKTRHPAIYDDAGGGYTWAANSTRMIANGHDANDLATLVNSQELKEVAGFDTGQLDHAGNPYLYQDAFIERSTYVTGCTDGGVITGLSGLDELDSQITNWGDQQVIRIEISKDTLVAGGITELRFFDFGDSIPGSDAGQVSPRMIVFHADPSGNLYLDDGVTQVFFPDNRIFIALADHMVPEPASVCIIGLGAAVMVALRRRRRA